MDRGAWWAAVHRVTESQTRLSDSQQQQQLKVQVVYNEMEKKKSNALSVKRNFCYRSGITNFSFWI